MFCDLFFRNKNIAGKTIRRLPSSGASSQLTVKSIIILTRSFLKFQQDLVGAIFGGRMDDANKPLWHNISFF
jgi:hypothetical protein